MHADTFRPCNAQTVKREGEEERITVCRQKLHIRRVCARCDTTFNLISFNYLVIYLQIFSTPRKQNCNIISSAQQQQQRSIN